MQEVKYVCHLIVPSNAGEEAYLRERGLELLEPTTTVTKRHASFSPNHSTEASLDNLEMNLWDVIGCHPLSFLN